MKYQVTTEGLEAIFYISNWNVKNSYSFHILERIADKVCDETKQPMEKRGKGLEYILKNSKSPYLYHQGLVRL